jgi:hypothetical protein
LAIKSGHFDICKLLLERGADSNYDTFLEQNLQTTLYAAVLSRNFDIVHLLISQPECQPDKTDRLGRSPFLEACALGHLDIVKLLLETGKIQTDIRPMKHPESCKIALSGKTPLTPLGYACIEGHFPVVQYLLQQGLSSSLDMDTIKLVLQLCPQAIVDLLTPAIAHLPNVKLSDGWSIVSSEFFPRLDIDLVHTFRDDSAVCSIGFSNDGKFVATGNNRSAQIYDVATGDKLHVLSHNFIGVFGDMYVRSVCFSPNSTYLATAAEDKRIRVSF